MSNPDPYQLLGECAEKIERLKYALRANVALLAAFVGPDDVVGQSVLRTGRKALADSAQGQRPMTQAERDAMNRALDKSVTVVDHGYSSTVPDDA